MPEMELNHADKWAPLPQPGQLLQGSSISARLIEMPDQYLISGNLAAFGLASGRDADGIGALGGVAGDIYSLRLSRDRLLVVGPLAGISLGWNADGYAVSATGAALAVIELTGQGVATLVGRATTLDPVEPGASVATNFAGISALVYHHGTALRLHVERGLTAYIWSWLNATFQDMAT